MISLWLMFVHFVHGNFKQNSNKCYTNFYICLLLLTPNYNLLHCCRLILDYLAAALGVEVKEITKYVNSVTFCLSKGLGAPVGSVICGSVDFIKRVRRARKMTGGTFLILLFLKVEISRAIVFDSCFVIYVLDDFECDLI